MAATLHVVGVGPGDPDLITLKAARTIAAADVVAYFCKAGRPGHARTIAAAHISPVCSELRFKYPFTIEVDLADPRYAAEIGAFYDRTAETVASHLDAGRDVALLCEGDPFFYGSSMYVYDRLSPYHVTRIIPGVTGMSGCWTQARAPITHGDDVLTVLPATMDEDGMTERLMSCHAAVIMKLGRNLPKVRAALARAGLTHRAIYVERGTMDGEIVRPFSDLTAERVPYFSMVLVPGRQTPR